MRKVQYDERGLPVAGTSNPSGNLTVRLDAKGWDMLGELRQRWSAERRMNLSVTDVVRAAIYAAHKVIADGPITPPAVVDAGDKNVCLGCVGVPAGDVYSCILCDRDIAENQKSDLMCIQGEAKPTEEKKKEVKKVVAQPAPVRPSRKKKG